MPTPLVRRFPYTTFALGFAVVVTVAGAVGHIDVFGLPSLRALGIADTEVAEVATAFLLVIAAFLYDRLVARRLRDDAAKRAEQLRVLHVTMRTVQDIVNNNLNQLNIIRLEAEACVTAETLGLFDQIILDTATEITALGNMEAFAEKAMVSGQGLDVGAVATFSQGS